MSTKKFTLGDITSALSRLFNQLVQHSGLARLAGALEKTVNEMMQFQKTGLDGSGFQSLAFNSASADLKLDATDAQKALREQAHNTNPTSAEGIAVRAALGWDIQRHGGTGVHGSGGRGTDGGSSEGSLLNSSPGSARVTSGSYTQELAGGPTYKALIDQGYKPAHIHDAMEFARHIGANQDMAQKFIKMDQASRDNLHHFVNDMRKNPAKTPEEENAKIEEFRKAHPEAAKHLTPEDIRKILHSQDKKSIDLKGGQLPFTEPQKDRTEEVKKIGVERQVEAQHAAAAAKLQGNNQAAKDDLDVLEAGIKQAEKAEGAKPAQNVRPPSQEKASAEAVQPKAPERHAARPKVDSPKV